MGSLGILHDKPFLRDIGTVMSKVVVIPCRTDKTFHTLRNSKLPTQSGLKHLCPSPMHTQARASECASRDQRQLFPQTRSQMNRRRGAFKPLHLNPDISKRLFSSARCCLNDTFPVWTAPSLWNCLTNSTQKLTFRVKLQCEIPFLVHLWDVPL